MRSFGKKVFILFHLKNAISVAIMKASVIFHCCKEANNYMFIIHTHTHTHETSAKKCKRFCAKKAISEIFQATKKEKMTNS